MYMQITISRFGPRWTVKTKDALGISYVVVEHLSDALALAYRK